MMPSASQAYQSLQAYKPRSNQDVMGEAETKYGLPEARTRLSSLRGLVGNLQSSVEAVDPSVTGRTSGSFVTEGQRQALVNKERTPILGDLGKQQGALGQEEASYNTSSGLAGQMASALMSQDQQTYQRLLDQYNAATASERETESKRQWEAQMAEQQRQFNEQQKTARATAGGAGGYNIADALNSALNATGGGNKSSQMTQRGDKGFNFTGADGKSISAAQYAQLKNIPFRDLLQQMASAGDKGAATGLKFIGNDYGYDPRKVDMNLNSLYQSLTGRSFGKNVTGPGSTNWLNNTWITK